MSLFAHLGELRRRLISAILAVILCGLGALAFVEELFEWFRIPLDGIPDQEMIVLTPLEMFITHLKLAAFVGIFVSFPWLLYQFWLFMSPALYKHERKWVVPFILFGTAFFVSGGLFAFYIVMPMGFEYLVALVPDSVSAQYSVAAYFSLVVRLLLAFGIVFELPLIMWFLTGAGIVLVEGFIKFRKYWIVVAVVLAALFTPPDPFTQLLMAIPLTLFFELGILGSRVFAKRHDKRKVRTNHKQKEPTGDNL